MTAHCSEIQVKKKFFTDQNKKNGNFNLFDIVYEGKQQKFEKWKGLFEGYCLIKIPTKLNYQLLMTVVMYLPNKGQESSTTMFWRVLRGSSRSGLGTLWEKHRYRMFWLREATLCLNCRSVISLVQNSLKKKNSGLCIHKRLVMMIARGNFNLAYNYYN